MRQPLKYFRPAADTPSYRRCARDGRRPVSSSDLSAASHVCPGGRPRGRPRGECFRAGELHARQSCGRRATRAGRTAVIERLGSLGVEIWTFGAASVRLSADSLRVIGWEDAGPAHCTRRFVLGLTRRARRRSAPGRTRTTWRDSWDAGCRSSRPLARDNAVAIRAERRNDRRRGPARDRLDRTPAGTFACKARDRSAPRPSRHPARRQQPGPRSLTRLPRSMR